MPRRRGPEQHQQQGNADEAASTSADDVAPATREQRACEFLRRAMRSETHWRASMAMAKCLGVPQAKLLLSTDKNDATNLVWTTVMVLLFFASQLADLHELWYEMADAATAWLYEQPHFTDNRDDLVASACALLGVRDVAATLETVFPEPKDEETRALEQALGDWKLCYLDVPPYTAYYWNETTTMSTWRNPLETAQLEKERLERKRQRDELLAKVLPMRVKINRDAFIPPANPSCEECAHRAAWKTKTSVPSASAPPHPVTIRCDACDGRFYCDECCDVVHATRDKLDHIEKSFRYVLCLGIKGFPTAQKNNKITISPQRTPQTNQ